MSSPADDDVGLQDADLPVAVCFAGLELVFTFCLSLVAFRIGFGNVPFEIVPSRICVLLSSILAFVGGVYCISTEEYAVAIVFLSQSVDDLSAWFISRRAASNGLLRGSASVWRAVVSCAMTTLSIPFVSGQAESRGLLLSVLLLRLFYILMPFLDSRIAKDDKMHGEEYLDEWGLLWNKWPAGNGKNVYTLASEEGYDSENPLEGILRNALSESLVNENNNSVNGSAPGTRNNSASTSDSTDSFPLVRPNSVLRDRSEEARRQPTASEASTGARPADDAAGPRSEEPLMLAHRLPEWVDVVSHREVLTTGGVPLVVYVLQTDRNGILVHRYGEFRALCNRVISKFYHELGAEAPPFPGRRVFRKFIPQSMGGFAQGADADREFIAARAESLGEWIQQVLEFVRSHPHSDATVIALVDFLKPIVHYSPESDLEQAIRSAVLIFSDTVLNPTAPPSPYL